MNIQLILIIQVDIILNIFFINIILQFVDVKKNYWFQSTEEHITSQNVTCKLSLWKFNETDLSGNYKQKCFFIILWFFIILKNLRKISFLSFLFNKKYLFKHIIKNQSVSYCKNDDKPARVSPSSGRSAPLSFSDKNWKATLWTSARLPAAARTISSNRK